MNRRSTIAANSPETTATTTQYRIYSDFDDNDDDTTSSSHDNHIDGNDVYMNHRIQRFIQTTLSPYDDDDDDGDDDEIHITSTGQTIQLQDLVNKKNYHIHNDDKNNIIHQPPLSSPSHRHVGSVPKTSHYARKYSDFFTWKIDSSVVSTKNSCCSIFIDHQIWLFCSIAIFTITILFLVSLHYCYYYNNHQRFIQKRVPPSKHESSSSSSSSTTKTTNTAVNTDTNTTTIPLSTTVIVESSKLKQNQINEPDNNMVHDIGTTISNDTVPSLIQELCVDNKFNPNNDVMIETLLLDDIPKISSDKMLRRQNLMTSTFPSTSLIPTADTITATTGTTTPNDDHDAVDHVITLVSTLQEKCQLQNIEYDNQVIWQWAIQQQTIKQQIKTQEMIQIRQCIYDHTQQTLNRYQQQQHHDTTVTLLREDTEWFTKLNIIRNHCYDTILRTIYQSCIGLCWVVLLRPILFIIQIFDYSNTSFMDVFCYNTGTRFDPNIHFTILPSSSSSNHNHHISSTTTTTTSSLSSYYDYYTSWYDRYISTFTFIDTYTLWAMGDVATCATFTLSRIIMILTIIIAWYMVSWFIQHLTGGISRLQFLCQSIFLVYMLYINHWIPTLYLCRIIVALGTIVSICYGTITYRYYTIRNKFLNMKNALPQITVVNLAISWFDDMVRHMQLIPIVVVSGLVFMLLTESK